MGVLIVGIAGGTGSGKTTIAGGVVDLLGQGQAILVGADSYYKGYGYQPGIGPKMVNYDHPDALDIPLLISHLETLSSGQPVAKPVYSFVTHSRTREVEVVQPRAIILVEGLLVLAQRVLRDLLDIKVFVDADADIRFIRRLRRDIEERGRTIEAVISQYLSTVRPMHLLFVEPSRQHADLTVSGMGDTREAAEAIVMKIRSFRPERKAL